ncbi:MAG TPA: hypothetical protein VFU36_05505 [Jatrophihabitans sp.]|nr:hypothetical protein [Jatrophihabitans sp.]
MPNAAKLAALGKMLADAPVGTPHTQYTRIGPDVANLSDEFAWHPLIDYVHERLIGLTTAQRAGVLTGWFGWLANRKKLAEAALQRAGLAAGLPAGLKKQTLPTAPKGLRTHFTDPFLRLVAGRHTTVSAEPDGTDQALAGLADQAGTVAAAAADPAVAAELLQQIRNLAEVYARWEAAAIVATKLLGTQLTKPALTAPELVTRLLAFFRTEGDLTVPAESDTLDTTLQQVPLPPGRSNFTPAFSITYYSYCGTYLIDQNKFAGVWGGKSPVVDADETQAFVLAGMDILWNQDYQREAEAYYPTGQPYPYTQLEDWWALNREKALGKTHDKAVELAIGDRDHRRLQLTGVAGAATGTHGPTYRVTPTGAAGYTGTASGASVEYLVGMLTESAWYLDRLAYGPTRFGPKAPTRLPEPIVYLLYHAGSEAPALLCSAARAAVRASPGSDAAQKLRAVLHQHGYTAAVAKAALAVNGVTKPPSTTFAALSDEQLKILGANWPTVAPVLSDPAVLPVLLDYITTADATDEWKSWKGMRENVIGFRRMYEFLKPQVSP